MTMYQRLSLRTAKDLGYGEEILEMIRNAKDAAAVERALATGRHRKEEEEYNRCIHRLAIINAVKRRKEA